MKQNEEISKNIEISINEIKFLFEDINKRKEELKLLVQQKFTKIRNCLNEKEDKLLVLIDEEYNKRK